MVVWSYGGGVQSAAIAVLILQGKLPYPDHVIIADTSREMSTTWEYMDNVVQPALHEIGLQIVVASHEFSNVDLKKNDKFLIPAFTRDWFGDAVPTPTYCSYEWKANVVRKCMRSLGINQADVWLGMSFEEIKRMKPAPVQWVQHVYPLIELIPMYRAQCITLVEKYGWPTPPRSRCWMCPNQSLALWKEMAEKHPEDFSRAVELEKDMQAENPTLYLHKSLIPIYDAVHEQKQSEEPDDFCESGYCFT